MSVKYCANFSQVAVSQNAVLQNAVLQSTVQRGTKVKSSLKQSLVFDARVSQGEETRQLAPKSSSRQVKNCLNAKPFSRNFSLFFRG
jgi:hypothetical protein